MLRIVTLSFYLGSGTAVRLGGHQGSRAELEGLRLAVGPGSEVELRATLRGAGEEDSPTCQHGSPGSPGPGVLGESPCGLSLSSLNIQRNVTFFVPQSGQVSSAVSLSFSSDNNLVLVETSPAIRQ